MHSFVTQQIVDGVLDCDNVTKQRLGQKFAAHLRLQSGTMGADDGIDGIAEVDGRQILFQSKLRNKKLGPDDAKVFFSDLRRHRMSVGIYLAGRGYTDEFTRVAEDLLTHAREGGRDVVVHFLTLFDLLDRTEALSRAASVLPALASADSALRTE